MLRDIPPQPSPVTAYLFRSEHAVEGAKITEARRSKRLNKNPSNWCDQNKCLCDNEPQKASFRF